MYKISDRLATSEFDSDSPNLIFEPDGKAWLVHDARELRDDGSNLLIDYAKHIFKIITTLDFANCVICCDAGISRSNALALGVLIEHFGMDFYPASDLIREKVPIAKIDPSHIAALKKLFSVDSTIFGQKTNADESSG
jgi:hypothetical protein